jgi:hypothetical protein
VGGALPLAGSVDIVMHVIVWHVGGRIDVFFVLLTSLRKLPSHTQRESKARLLFSQNVDIVNFSVTLSILRSLIFIQRSVGRVVRELHSSASLFFWTDRIVVWLSQYIHSYIYGLVSLVYH